jgi:RNA polymerase sigma-70 factor (ECF subfamily)
MNEQERLAELFEQHRPRMRGVAYRMLGWLRFSRTDTSQVHDLRAWLTTVVARICLNVLRSRAARREDPTDPHLPDPIVSATDTVTPEDEALTADSVGLAMLIVLETLRPAERLAFVLHDVFDVPFEEIAKILDRSEPATRQLASRARRRVRAAPRPDARPAHQWELVEAFLAAARNGDFGALVNVLHPDVVLRVDAGATGPGGSRLARGAEAVASGAVAFQNLGLAAHRVLVNGAPGVVTFAGDEPFSLVGFTVAGGRVVEMNVITDPVRLRRLVPTVPGE